MLFLVLRSARPYAYGGVLSSYSFKDRKRLFYHELMFPTINPINYLNRFEHKQYILILETKKSYI